MYAALRMLAFRDLCALFHAGLSLGTKYAALLVLVFLGACRLLFGKGRVCGCPTQSKHQADNLAKLRQEFLSVTELIAKIFGAVSRTTSLMRLSALLACKRCRCRNDGFSSEQERHGLKQNPTYKTYVILGQVVPDEVRRSIVAFGKNAINR